MKTKKAIGIVLIIIGLLMAVYTSFNFVTTENAIDLGKIKIEREKNHFVQWSPLVGVVVFLLGGLFLVRDKSSSTS